MKNFIVGGVPRSGKSGLCRRLSSELNLSHYPIDSLVSTFGKVFPELGISHYAKSHLEICHHLWPFLLEFLKQLEYENLNYVIDAYHIRPQDIVENINQEDCQVIFLGYPSITPLKKTENIRSYARAIDWTEELSEPELMKLVERYIEESQKLERDCKKYEIEFVDTSYDYSGVLDKVCGELIAQIKT